MKTCPFRECSFPEGECLEFCSVDHIKRRVKAGEVPPDPVWPDPIPDTVENMRGWCVAVLLWVAVMFLALGSYVILGGTFG